MPPASGTVSSSAAAMPPGAMILTIGDELLSGDRIDTNACWLARFLTERGVAVLRISSVGDELEAIRSIVSECLGRLSAPSTRGGLIVATGGLGPTRDDRTREAVAGLLGRALRPDPRVRERIAERFRAMGREDIPHTNRRVTRVPEGAMVLENRAGTAPGLVIEAAAGVRIVMLPGVPAEMRHLAEDRVGTLLDDWFPDRPAPVARRVLHTTGIPESELAARLEEEASGLEGVNLAYRPSVRGVELVLSVQGPGAEQRIAEAESTLAPTLAPWRIEDPSGDVATDVLEAFRERQWTLATGESCTGGLLGTRLTDVPGSSDVYQGGVVAYSNHAKSMMLGVPRELIEEHGAVSGPVARALATGARERFDAGVGVGITGIAGPGGGTVAKPVGTVWFAVNGPDGVEVEQRRFPGDRREVRDRAAQHALHRLLARANPGPREG